MLNRFFAALVAVLTLSISACSPDVDPETPGENPNTITLSVSPETVSLFAVESQATVQVTTNATSWSYIDAASWLTIEKEGNTLVLTARENKSDDPRRCELVVFATSGDNRAEKTIFVTQKGANDMSQGEASMFECEVFKELMLSNFDTNGDEVISDAEAARVTEIDVEWTSENAEERSVISSLKGIKIFKNLKYLYCANNLITTLDVSGMEKLEFIECPYNEMTSLNASNCPSLKWIYCYSNDLKTLNIYGSNNLVILQAYKNKLTSINVSGMKELVYFDVLMNELRDVDFSNCPELQIAAVGGNNLTSLNLKGLPKFYTLGCYENNITSLDLSELPELEMLECYTNNLLDLDLSANKKLVTLNCQNNLLANLNIEGCTALSTLNCGNNFLEGALDLSAYTSLKHLNCGGNKFASINVTASILLEDINCANTNITELDVTTLTALKSLKANDCQLTVMDCSNNLNLNTLYLQGNPLTSLILAEGQGIGDLKIDNYDVISYK